MARFSVYLWTVLLLSLVGIAGTAARGQGPKQLSAQFTATPPVVDGAVDAVWSTAPASPITLCENTALTAAASGCTTSATVQGLWNGPVLYLLFRVTDADVTTAASAVTNQSSVQLWIDQDNDKFPKFEEDDSTITISAAGVQSGNATNAGLTIYPTAWSSRLKAYAAALTKANGATTGYNVELAWYIGDRPLVNGTRLGMEFGVYSASSATKTNRYIQFWNGVPVKNTDDNSGWGEVALAGYDGVSAMALNNFMLNINIAKAQGLVRGVYQDETALNSALSNAVATQSTATTQAQIDAANLALDAALRGLRRSGKYPDPLDLPTVNNLPDPFTNFDGSKVKLLADWNRRKAEIKDLAQYYEFGYMPAPPQVLTATSKASTTGSTAYRTISVSITDNGRNASFTPILYLPTTGTAPYPVIVEEDIFANPSFAPPNTAFTSAGYAVLSIPVADYTAFGLPGIASDDGNHTGTFFNLYPYKLDNAGNDHGVLLAWAWGASRGVDALQYLAANDPTYANLLDLKRLVVTGFSRYGKASLVAGLLDERFLVTAPGGSGAGGAAPYRYDSFGNTPFRTNATVGNVYPWGQSPGAEVLGDHVRHQTHNSNEMIRRFLNDTVPAAVEPRMYQTNTWGYGGRMPFDHHEEIAAIAPRAVLIDNTNDDYADNAEGDSIGFEGAMPVYKYLGVPQNLALDLYMGGGGHSLKPSQAANIVKFSNFVLYGTPLDSATNTQLTTDPYLNAGTYNTYYGGFSTMMPWLSTVPHANLLTGLSVSAGTLSPVFSTDTTSYSFNVTNAVAATTVTATGDDSKAAITVNGVAVPNGAASVSLPLSIGYNVLNVQVTAVDGAVRTYQVVVNRDGVPTTTTLASSNLNSNLNAAVTFTATVTTGAGPVAPTGTISFYDAGNVIGTGALVATGATTATATYSTSALTAGTHSITAAFPGTYGFDSSNSAVLSQVVTAPAIQAAFASTSITITRGSTGTNVLTVKPMGGFTGTVTVGCGSPAAGLSCSFSPSTLSFVAGSTASQTATVTIGTSGMAAMDAPAGPGRIASRTTLAFLMLPGWGLLAAFRRRRGLRTMLLVLVSVATAVGISGCGDSGPKGAAAGSYSMNINVTAGGTTQNVPFTVNVQ